MSAFMAIGGGDDGYNELLQALEQAKASIERLEELPSAPKIETALQLLREHQSFLLRRLAEIDSEDHCN